MQACIGVGSACVMWVCMGVRVLAFQLARSGDTPRTHISLRALLARVIPAAGACKGPPSKSDPWPLAGLGPTSIKNWGAVGTGRDRGEGIGPHYMAGKVNQLPGGPYPFPRIYQSFLRTVWEGRPGTIRKLMPGLSSPISLHSPGVPAPYSLPRVCGCPGPRGRIL